MYVQCYLIWSFPLEACNFLKKENKLEAPIHKTFNNPENEEYELNKN